MSAASFNKQTLTVGILSLIGIGLLAVIFYTSIWWVSLTAPNYPVESFPDGVRIEFHINGVFNGCTLQKKAEILEEEALDCVHEMDTINHYVGMFPGCLHDGDAGRFYVYQTKDTHAFDDAWFCHHSSVDVSCDV